MPAQMPALRSGRLPQSEAEAEAALEVGGPKGHKTCNIHMSDGFYLL